MEGVYRGNGGGDGEREGEGEERPWESPITDATRGHTRGKVTLTSDNA